MAIPPPMLVKSCTVKPIYQDRGGFEDVYIQTCRTHLCYHITAVTLYMISHHITDIMIGQTLQSMLVIIYKRHRHTLHWTGGDEEPLAASQLVSMLQQKSRQTEKHRRDGRVTQLTARKLIGLVGGCDWFHGQFLSLPRKRDGLLLCNNVWDEAGCPSRLLQRCVHGAGPEWSWVEEGTHARQDCGRLGE